MSGHRVYHPLAVDENDDVELDAYSDSDYEQDLPDESIPENVGFEQEDVSDFRSNSTSPTISHLPSSNSTLSVGSDSSSCASASRNPYLYPEMDTVEALRPEEVRWLYKDSGDKRWTPFIGYDSLRIECKHRETLQSLGGKNTVHGEAEDTERVIIRGGLYEVDVMKRKCYPIYWTQKDDPIPILRGSWFLHGTWQPIEEEYANQIETEHLANFEKQKISHNEPEAAAKGLTPVIHNIKFKEFHIDWNSVVKVYLHYESASSKFYRAVGTKLGLNKSGTKLHRGYKEEAKMDDKPPDITHLVFVIHGIGQKMETGSIIKSCNELRVISNKQKEKYFPDLDSENKRVEFLPVEWRSSLRLDGDTVESITPNKLKGLRTMLNSSAMDILYYTSPLYRSEITQGLQTELNKLYLMFCSRHPYFEASGGKVSIVAHSLGCVITYDIITGWNPIQLYDQYVNSFIGSSTIVGNKIFFSLDHVDPKELLEEKCQQMQNNCSNLVSELEKARERVSEIEKEILKQAEKQHLKTPSLKFKLDSFFCIGSPLAVFLALRGVRPHPSATQESILLKSICNRLYNVYHPFDPVAYRLEPLIQKSYENIKPLKIHRYDSTKKDPYDRLPAIPIAPDPNPRKEENWQEIVKAEEIEENKIKTDSEQTSEEQLDKISPAKKGGWKFVFRRNKKNKEKDKEDNEDSAPSSPRKVPLSDGECEISLPDIEITKSDIEINKIPMEDEIKTELEHRLDYQLREGKMENAYLSALTSHTSYWVNQDVAMFMLTQIFPDYGPR